jgi:hypothetical protein
MAEYSIPYAIDTPMGTLEFNGTGFPRMELNDVSGNDGGALRTGIDDRPGYDGSSVRDAYLSACYPTLSGEIHSAGAEGVYEGVRRQYEDRLRDYLGSIKRADGTLRWLPSGYELWDQNILNGGDAEEPNFNVNGYDDTNVLMTQDRDAAHTGGYGYRIVCSTAAGADAVYVGFTSGIVACLPSTKYTASYWVRRAAGTARQMDLDFVWFTGGLGFIGENPSASLLATTEWQRVSITMISPSNAGRVSVRARFHTAPSVNDAVDMDDVMMNEGELVPAVPVFDHRDNQRRRTVRLFQPPIIGKGSTLLLKAFNFGLVAADPLAYGLTYRPYTSAKGFVDGHTDVFVPNNGSMPTPLLMRAYGPCTDPVITNLTTGQEISLPGYTIPAGRNIQIVTDRQTVVLDDGSNIIGEVPYSSEYFYADPGITQIRYAGSGGNGDEKLTVFLSDAWNG